MKRGLLVGTWLVLAFPALALAQDQGWRHSGSLYLLTTPEGADLPASASEEGFPLLVRLHEDFFDFSQARANGEDIRFATGAGAPLAYQIDEWDAAAGTASVWVRIPTIKGNAHQEIKMLWGKADAASESKGSAVFSESNGYLSVWHMNDAVKDEVGTLESKDLGTTITSGVIGKGRHFADGKGINCGENVTTYPTGSNPHSSELWFRADRLGDRILCWGNGEPQAVVQMILGKPPRVFMDCYHSGADVRGSSTLARSQWVHVIHTYKKGESRLYVNGRLDAVSTSGGSPLALKSPAKVYMGGWGGHYVFNGDMDEVRISKVARSADWVRLQYENQKPMQTAVGPLVQKGTDFSVSEKMLTVLEGRSATVSARAGGAQKLYWILKADGQERVVAVDRFSFTFDAGRVRGDTSLILQLKAVYANEVKTRDIPIAVKEDIPDPVFTLKASATWDGRETIGVAANIANLAEMQAKGAGELKYTWAVSGIAVIKEIAPGKLILRRAQNSGKMTVTVAIHNGGTEMTAAATILVKEPRKDAWVQRTPAKDEKPEDNQFYARDDKNEGTLYYNGTLDRAADAVFLKVYTDDTLIKTEIQKPAADKSYALSAKLKADPADHLNTTHSAHSIYRNLMKRIVAAKLTHGIRGVLWHQGESDQGMDGPGNCFGCDTYQQYFIDLSAAWKQDFPNIQHYYVFQIWPNSCSMGGNGASDRLRDMERRLSRLYSNLSVMSTLSLPSGACHFNLTDYEKMGLSMARLVERDNYGKVFEKPIASPDLQKAYYTSDKKDEIALEFDQPMAWNDALTSQFYLDGKEGKIAAGSVSENVVKLKLTAAEAAKTITYLVDRKWDIKNLLYGENGIAALTFCDVVIDQ
jgi:hypothetical protein